MSGEVKVSGGEIAALAERLQQTHRAMSEELTKLQGALDRLSVEWSGEAQQAYKRAQTRWNDALHALNNEIDRLRRRTQEANEAFLETERANMRLWS